VAAVELLRRPELRGLPVVVGGDGDPTKRGVVSTASYEARAFGVTSGVPLRTAARRCPDAVFLPVDAEAYTAASGRVMDALRSFGGPVEVLGWDEAFLSYEGEAPPEVRARDIQRRVQERTDLACTVGIGRNKLQAKLATGFGKPAGVYRLTDDNWFELLGERGPDALWGIGSRTAKRLATLGVTTVAQLAAADPARLAAEFGPATGPWLVQLGQGRGGTTISAEPWVARSRSRETTFQENLEDWSLVRAAVADLARSLAPSGEERAVLRVVVKVRFAPFSTETHGAALPQADTDPEAIVAAAQVALERFTRRRPVRLVGVRVEYAPHVSPQ
jgi:nucleotidyltransferase/DNA polymerase involved in DNA repair